MMSDSQLDLLRRLLTLDPGWLSNAEVMFNLEPDDHEARSAVRRALGDVARAKLVETLYIRHRGQPMLCIKVDPLALTAALAAEKQ